MNIAMCFWRRSRKCTQTQTATDEAAETTPISPDVFMVDMNVEQISMDGFDASITRSVRLSRNKLASLPDEFIQLRALRLLDASDNSLRTIPSLCVWIQHLNLERNPIMHMHACKNYVHLRTLKLATCNITEVPPEIGYLSSLVTLEVHENQISSIHPNIGALRNLERLSLHNNRIAEVPDTIGNLRKVWYLSLHYNQIKALPKSIGNLKSLSRLSLHQNQLTTLPEEMVNCEQLEVISLFKNHLEYIPEKVFTGWQKCKKLALQQNNLTKLPSTITFLISLEEIWMCNNPFVNIPISLIQIQELTSIKRLWIDKRFKDECIKWNIHIPIINFVPP